MCETKTIIYETMIREQYLDSLGHVNNAAYATLFEEARWQLVTDGGFGLDNVKRTGLSPVIIEMNLRFRREVCNREKIRIETRCLSYLGKISKLEQVMYNEKGEAACVGKFTFGLFDLNSRHLVDPTPEWLKAIGAS
ncbi:MAG: acyl-CoA thioesterase [Elusimicrobiota bacterium]